MKLSKKVAARTKSITAEWCKKEFMEMSPQFRAVRAKARNKMDKCYWCKHPFEDGEMMGLACFEKGGNKALCQTCADELLKSEVRHGTEEGESCHRNECQGVIQLEELVGCCCHLGNPPCSACMNRGLECNKCYWNSKDDA